MTGQRFLKAILVALMLMLAVPATAQTSTVSSNDIQRLQDEIYEANRDVSRLRSTDSTTALRLQEDLDQLRDEVTYLKVKMRKEGSVNRTEYADLRDRIQSLRSQARGESTGTRQGSGTYSGSSGSSTSTSGGVERDTRTGTSGERRSGDSAIPTGTEVDVRLQSELTSDTAQVEDRFEATTVVDLYEGSRVLIPAGSMMRGVVSSVNRASRTDRKGSLTVSFDQVTLNGRTYPMRGTVTQALESGGIKEEIGRIGAGSAVGAIIGGIIGGVKGALIGVLIGGGGTMVATEGKDVHLPAGTILRVRLDSPPQIR
jgi:hypothetical protein